MYWWLNPIPPCCDPSLVEPVKLPFGENESFGDDSSGSEGKKYVFGRKGDCSMRLKDQSISGHHCTIHIDGTLKGLLLTDTSTNGTFLNGKRLTKAVPVQITDGDIISLTRPKMTDDNIAFHAVFRLVFSGVSPGGESDSFSEKMETGVSDSILDVRVGKVRDSTRDARMEDSYQKVKEKQSEETSSGRKEVTVTSGNERKSSRSSMSLRSQDRRGRLSSKDDTKVEEHIPKRSRGRPRTSDRGETDEVTNAEDGNKMKVDEHSIGREEDKGREAEMRDVEQVGDGEKVGNSDNEDRVLGTRKEVSNEVEGLEKRKSSVDSISQLFDSGNSDANHSFHEKRVSVTSQKSTSQEDKSLESGNVTEVSNLLSEKKKEMSTSAKRSSFDLVDKLENLELLVSRKEGLERSLRGELDSREEEINRLREILERSEINEQQTRQHNIALMEEIQNLQRQNLDLEHELMDYQERCRVLSASGEAMDQTINQLSEELSAIRQELLVANEKYNQQSLALKSITQLTHRKCLSILHSLKDIHQLSNTYGSGTGGSASGGMTGNSVTGFSTAGSTLTPWRNGKRSLNTNYGYSGLAGAPQTERPYKMRSSPISSSRNVAGDGGFRRTSYSGNNISSGDDFDSFGRNGVLGGSSVQCVSSNRFISGSSQLEEQLISSLKPSSLDIQNISTSANTCVNQVILDEVEPSTSKTITQSIDSEDKSLTQQVNSGNYILEKVQNTLRSRKEDGLDSSLAIDSLVNKENSIGNI
ncbi:FHA domain-containing protein [Cryptosporidium felis]|nr:FHA domain-containing protein [Cryptosporidium felis]